MNKKYIYESPDGGDTVYRHEIGKDDREVMVDGKWIKEEKWLKWRVNE